MCCKCHSSLNLEKNYCSVSASLAIKTSLKCLIFLLSIWIIKHFCNKIKDSKEEVELLMPNHTGLKGIIIADTHCHWGLRTLKWAGLPVRWETAQTSKSRVHSILPFFTLGEKIPLSRINMKYNTQRRISRRIPQNSPKKPPNHLENKVVLICTSDSRKFSPMMLGFSHQTEVK